MSVEPLAAQDSIVHQYYHDLEFFFWVVVFAAMCFSDHAGPVDSPLLQWADLDDSDLAKERTHFLVPVLRS